MKNFTDDMHVKLDKKGFWETLLVDYRPQPGLYDFIPGDTQFKFKKNMTHKSSLMKKLGWDKINIQYTVNTLGARETFELDKDIEYTVFLGCSHTFGIGLPSELIWTHHVKQYFNDPCVNLGVPGGGINSCVRNLLYLQKHNYKVKRVFMLTPHYQRIDMFDPGEDNYQSIAWWSSHKDELKKFVTHPFNSYYNTILSKQAIENICNKLQAELIFIDNDEPMIDKEMLNDTTARDLEHSGKDSHLFIGKEFIKRYEQQYR